MLDRLQQTIYGLKSAYIRLYERGLVRFGVNRGSEPVTEKKRQIDKLLCI